VRSRDELRAALTGPVASLRTPFKKSGDIDFASLRRMVDFDVEAGSGTLLLTAGDSLYSLLTPDEIAEVTRVVIDQAAGRAMVVAADSNYATPQAVKFAQFAGQAGADLYMAKPPDWATSVTPESLAEHFAAIAEHIPVMMVTNIFAPHGHSFGLKTIELVMERAPGVVAVKDDICGKFGQAMALLVHEQWIVFSGGRKQNHLDIHPYGCDGYLSTFITLKPGIAHRYWKAIQTNDIPAAVGVIREYEAPLFNFIMGLPGGFDAGMHGMMELFGLAERWRRPPFHSLGDGEMATLSGVLKGLGLL